MYVYKIKNGHRWTLQKKHLFAGLNNHFISTWLEYFSNVHMPFLLYSTL